MAERVTLNQRKKSGRSKPSVTLSELKRQALPYRAWYKMKRWVEERAAFLKENPFCVDVFGFHGGTLAVANVVDHKVPHKGDWDLFWDCLNWQSMCKPCHDYKTATEDGGFGNKIKNYDDEGVIPC